MKVKKRYIVLSILLIIFLLITWYVYNTLRVWECHEYPEFKKANEIIQSIEKYIKLHGKIPDSLEDIGEKEDPIFYSKFPNNNYIVYFATGGLGCFFCCCSYDSETKEWINTD